MIRRFLFASAIAVAPVLAVAEGTSKVLSIGGSVTEIVYALGQQDRLIARDSTSSYPADATALPDVGYMRALSPEGVLSVGPELIISEEGAGPVETIDVLRQANIPFVQVPDTFSSDGIAAKIRAVGAALDVTAEADALAAEVASQIVAAEATAADLAGEDKQKVLFILSTQGGRIMASGVDTAADAIITMAGGINVIDSFDGYKSLSDEAISAAAPDVVLMMDRGGDHGAANADLFALPGLIGTPAAQTDSVIRMDGLYLLGFGPRTGNAVLDLAQALYGE